MYIYYDDLGERRKIKIMLLAGGDLIASFGHPGVWSPEDVCCFSRNPKIKKELAHIHSTNGNNSYYLVTSYCGSLWMCNY